jgi:hypothetical protein
MNPRKIAVICCTNDPSAFEECHAYLQTLELPSGFGLEIVPVEGASGMAAGYNEGMRRTDAKYKFYLHQDVLVIHRAFFIDLISLFEQNPSIGLIGMVGAKRLPESGVWWEAGERTGKVYHSGSGVMRLLDFGNDSGGWLDVQAIDGLLMATQYDLPWRADWFPGWHFYDASQSLEFIRAGYQVAVSSQDTAWCVHDCGITPIGPDFQEARETFCLHYRDNLQPTKTESECADC